MLVVLFLLIQSIISVSVKRRYRPKINKKKFKSSAWIAEDESTSHVILGTLKQGDTLRR